MSKQHFCQICKTNISMSEWSEHMLFKHLEALMPAIKGENSGHNGGEHTPCCVDWGCYGCEDCDCEDCLQGENK